MPYDSKKAHELRKTALAYNHTVMGEFIGEMAQCLIDAEDEIRKLTVGTVDTRAETEEANRRLMMESQAHRATKEKLTADVQHLTEQKAALVDTLNKIAADARGAKALAHEAVAKLNAVQEVKP